MTGRSATGSVVNLGLPLVSAALVALAPASALAVSFGVGLEGGATNSHAWESTATGGLGIVVEQRFRLALIELALWEDVQSPFGMGRQGRDGRGGSGGGV